MNIATLLAAGGRRAPSRTAWQYGDRSATYAQLADRVAALAAGLRRLGLKPGDRVALLLPNSPELVEALFAAMWGGFVAVPLNWHLHPQEVAWIVRHCAAGAIVVAAETESVVDAFDTDLHVLHTEHGYESVFGEGRAPLAQVEPDDPAWLFYTSGTTGRPKGATLTHRNLLAMTLNYLADIDPIAPDSVFVHAAPLTHGSGLYLLPALGRAATNVISTARSFDPDDYLTLLARHRATHAAFMAPTMLKRLLVASDPASHDLSALRSIVIGGAPLYRTDLRAAVAAFGPIITQIYGQGESPMTITAMPPPRLEDFADDTERLGSCGRAFVGVQVRVVDGSSDGSGEGSDVELPPGVDGEVCVRGDVVMRGYWDDPDATAKALRGGWLHTGDIGHLDADGFLHLTDRAKDVIITGGSNVYPREVEEVLLTHPGVREVAVVGRPDPDWGESVCAFVVAEAGAEVDATALVAHCKGQLASFKKPKDVVFIDALPKSAAGKILKRELRAG
ncbi:MAG: long-chain fatty acid--CoA ligase [Pseudonocardia sp.]|nr:long-chain fatty acid--CoA ligase [Pseudonocardia sp.]